MIHIEEFLKDWHKVIQIYTEEDAAILKTLFLERGVEWSDVHSVSDVTHLIEYEQQCYVGCVSESRTKVGLFTNALLDDIIYDISQVILHRSIDADAFENILFM
jgi:hypothetical protein